MPQPRGNDQISFILGHFPIQFSSELPTAHKMLSVDFGINFDKQLIDTERIFDLGVILHKNNIMLYPTC